MTQNLLHIGISPMYCISSATFLEFSSISKASWKDPLSFWGTNGPRIALKWTQNFSNNSNWQKSWIKFSYFYHIIHVLLAKKIYPSFSCVFIDTLFGMKQQAVKVHSWISPTWIVLASIYVWLLPFCVSWLGPIFVVTLRDTLVSYIGYSLYSSLHKPKGLL